jgi:hypothetical protein
VSDTGEPLLGWQALGVALFLFIPLVLFLLVRHPEPVGVSLVAGLVLIVVHRFLARPYMRAVRARKCLWCNGRPRPRGEELALATAGGELVASVCPRHDERARSFFKFLERARLPLRLGIFVPLLALIAALAAASFGELRYVDAAVAFFQLAVGVTVNVAALGYLAARPAAADVVPRVPFPAHNFFLLGVRNLLWVFRLVGIWWIARGVMFFVS